MTRLSLFVGTCLLLLSTAARGQYTLANWSFEGVTASSTASSVPALTAGSMAADAGLLAAGSAFTGYHVNAATVWSNAAGNASTKSFSSTAWGVGDYYQFSFSTVGYISISITWDQTGSNTGPRDFVVKYSTDGTTFTTAPGASSYAVTNDSWSTSGAAKLASRRTLDLSSITDLNNQSTVYIRLIDNSTVCVNAGVVAPAGSNRVDNFVATAAELLLPVELTSFTAQLHGTTAILKWATATEVNNMGFEVERREVNSASWEKIGFVEGAGTCNSPKMYSFVDQKLSAGVFEYRLKQIDRDGGFEYSATTVVEANAAPKTYQMLNNYPNPFNPATEIRFAVPENGQATLIVYNALGQQVATLYNGMAQAGQYVTATFNASHLASGVYIARLQYAGKSLMQKMMLAK